MARFLKSRLLSNLTATKDHQKIINNNLYPSSMFKFKCRFGYPSVVSLPAFTYKPKSLSNPPPSFHSNKEPLLVESLLVYLQRKFWAFVLHPAFYAPAMAVLLITVFTCEEIDDFTKEFRLTAKMITVEDDAPPVKKYKALLYSAAMTVPSKCIEKYLDIRRPLEGPTYNKSLPDLSPQEQKLGVKTIVLDLNETLISRKYWRDTRWLKRPGLDVFLHTISQFYEVVIYTEEEAEYIGPMISRLNQGGAIRYILWRDCTKYHIRHHMYYRDLSKLNRDLSKVIYISAHAPKNTLQPENSIPIKPWKPDDHTDRTLVDLLPFLVSLAREGPTCPDVREVLQSYRG